MIPVSPSARSGSRNASSSAETDETVCEPNKFQFELTFEDDKEGERDQKEAEEPKVSPSIVLRHPVIRIREEDDIKEEDLEETGDTTV